MDNTLTSKKHILMSFIYAYLISIGFLNAVIGVAFKTGGMIINIGIVLGLVCLNFRQILGVRIRPAVIVYICLVLGVYLVTTAVAHTDLERSNFYFYFALTSFLGVFECDYEKVLRYIMHISLITLPFYSELLGNIMEFGIGSVSMGASFAMMPVFMAGIIHFFFFYRRGKIFDKICYSLDAFFMIEIIFKGNRGIALMALITFFCLYIKNWGIDRERKKISWRLIVVMIAVILIYYNFYAILDWLNEILKSLNINANFIEKTLRLQKAGDVSNGRNYIFNYTMSEIIKSPFWGHGIATIRYNSDYRIAYPHNFILQLFYDGGLLLAIPVLTILWKGIRYAFNGENRSSAAFLLYMVLINVPKMLFSADVWRNPAFWLMIVHVLQFYSKKTKNNVGEMSDDKLI